MLPDIDTVLNFTGPVGELVWHRSFTHSLWFGPVVGPLLGFLLWRRSGRTPGLLGSWGLLFVIALFTHPLLDLFTTYGTQLLHPFSDRRFGLDAVAILDPAYSLILVLGLVVGWRAGWSTTFGRAGAGSALALSTAYLFYGLWLNDAARERVRTELAAEGIVDARVESYPTLLQLHLRRIVVRNGSQVRVGWLSLWTGREEWETFHAPQHALLDAARSTREGRILEWFSSGQTLGRVREGTGGRVVEIDDLRYGLPSRPRQGLWGLRFRFDATGRFVPPVERYNRPLPEPASVLLGWIWRAAFVRPQAPLH